MKLTWQRAVWAVLGIAGLLGASLLLLWIMGPSGLFLGLGLTGAVCLTLIIGANPVIGLFLLLFFLPFERIPSIDLGGVSLKANLLVGGLTLVSTVLAIATKQVKLRLQSVHWLSLAFVGICLLGLTGAVEHGRAIQVIVFTLFTMGLAWVVPQLLDSQALLRRALTVLFWSAVVVGVFGLYQFVGDLIGLPHALTGIDAGFSKAVFGFPRIQAFSLEPLYLGNYLLLPLSLLFAAILSDLQRVSRWLLWAAFALLSIVLVLTVARGAYIGAAVSVCIILVSLPREVLQPKHLLIGIGMIVLVAGASYQFLLHSADNEAGSALENFQQHVLLGDVVGSESGEGRLSTYAQAYQLWQQHPWLGVGPGNFGPASTGYPDPATVEHPPIVNNEYLELLAETGLVGFLTIIALLGVVISRSVIALRRATDPLLRATLIGTTAALIGMLVQYNFFSTLYIIHIWVTIGLLLAVQTIAMSKQQSGAA